MHGILNKNFKDEADDDPLKNIRPNSTTMKTLQEVYTQREEKEKEKEKLNENEKEYKPETAFTAESFTSTTASLTTKNITTLDKNQKRPKKKGYVQLVTSFGNINIELHCDLTPKACENFIGLCESGYYKNTIFHRLIPDFMIQGGDPTATGRGGDSIWHKKFEDEFSHYLTHSGRGVVSMANSGPNTNGSQFFITFKTQIHLDNKHTVFGKVVGGMNILDTIEKLPTDYKERPKEEVRIIDTTVFVNPFKDLEKDEAEEKKRMIDQNKSIEKGNWFSNPSGKLTQKTKGEEVGKYLTMPANKKRTLALTEPVNTLTTEQSTKIAKKEDKFANW